MKILQLNKYITINGGSETVMDNLYSLLKQNGHAVFNMGYHKKNQVFVENSIDLGEELQNLKSFFYNSEICDRIVSYINDNNIELLIAHNIYHHFPIYQLMRDIKQKTKARTILYLHDYKVVCPVYNLLNHNILCEKCSKKNFYSCTLNRCKDNSFIKSFLLSAESYYNNKVNDAYSYFDKIISPSYFLRDKVFSMGFRHHIDVLHNPLPPMDSELNSMRKDVILFVGRLSDEKGIKVLVNLIQSLKNIEFHVIGSGPEKDYFIEQTIECSNLIYHGYQKQKFIYEKMTVSRYLLITSVVHENNPMVVLEAMANGLPVIGSNRGGIPELIEKERGAIFEPLDIENTLKTINDMMKISENEYDDMSNKCKDFASKKSFDKYYQEFNKILNMEKK